MAVHLQYCKCTEEVPRLSTRIGDKIKRKRESLKLTQAALAESSGVPQGYLSQIERGKRRPSLDTLRKLRDGLGVKEGEFISWVDVA